MSLCTFCSKVPFTDLPLFPRYSSAQYGPQGTGTLLYDLEENINNINNDRQVLGLLYHTSLEALRVASTSCALCHLVWRSCYRVIYQDKEVDVKSLNRSRSPVMQLVGPLRIHRRESERSGFAVLGRVATPKPGEFLLLAALGFCVRSESPWASMYPVQPVPVDPSDPSVYQRLQSWLSNCIENHDHTVVREKNSPSRILDVNCDSISEEKIKVVEGLEDIRYVALSHCWGSSQQFKALRTNIKSLRHGVYLGSLPKTFQDAVEVTRKLGFRYLWIDSLCILQDDKEDWEREAGKMASVYEGAIVTITADRARDDSEGFLSPRLERTYVKITGYAIENAGSVYVFAIDIDNEWKRGFDTKMEDEPLSKRAWALQERLLSVRKFHFPHDQVAFECKSHFLTEDGHHFSDPLNFLGDDPREPGSRSKERATLYDPYWSPIISWYTKRELTHISDKLPALAGLARRFDRGSTNIQAPQYLAGLWRNNIVPELCWYSDAPKISQQYIAPSWSWASIDGPVYPHRGWQFESVAVLEDAHVSVPGGNPYGLVTAGWVHLRAPYVKAEPVISKSDKNGIIVECGSVVSAASEVWWNPDANGTTPDEQYFLVAAMGTYEQFTGQCKERELAGLILKRLPGDVRNGFSQEVFCRVGIAFFRGEIIDEFIALKEIGACQDIILV